MIGYTKGYVLRNVTGKTKGLQVFLDDVTKLMFRNIWMTETSSLPVIRKTNCAAAIVSQ